MCEELVETNSLVSEVPVYEHLFGDILERKAQYIKNIEKPIQEKKENARIKTGR